MDSTVTELILTGSGVVVGLGLIIIGVYNTASKTLSTRFSQVNATITATHTEINNSLKDIANELRTVNGRVTRLEVVNNEQHRRLDGHGLELRELRTKVETK